MLSLFNVLRYVQIFPNSLSMHVTEILSSLTLKKTLVYYSIRTARLLSQCIPIYIYIYKSADLIDHEIVLRINTGFKNKRQGENMSYHVCIIFVR